VSDVFDVFRVKGFEEKKQRGERGVGRGAAKDLTGDLPHFVVLVDADLGWWAQGGGVERYRKAKTEK
jgi:hypothetical protein